MENRVLFIGGAPGVGKTTFIRGYVSKRNIAYLKRNNIYEHIAEERHIGKDTMFEKISSDEVDELFVNQVMKLHSVICDIHYVFPQGLYNRKNKYLRTLKDGFMQSLINNKVDVGLLLVEADYDLAWNRLVSRVGDKRLLGTFTYEDLILQAEEEKKEWECLGQKYNLCTFRFDTTELGIIGKKVDSFFGLVI